MRWEYRIEPFTVDDLRLMQDSLNSLGREGWELVAVVPGATGTDNRWPVVVCKRPLPHAPKPN